MTERLSIFNSGSDLDKSEADWAVITGASDGIGRSYALNLAKSGYNVRLVARSEDKLAKVAEEAMQLNPNIKADTVKMDLAKANPSDFAQLFDQRGRTSIVINCAGVMHNQKLLQSDPIGLEAMIRVNVHPYVYMTKYALKHFDDKANEHKKRNAIVYISGMACWFGMPYFGVAAGSKAFSYGLSNLTRKYIERSENFKGLVIVQSLHPSYVRTKLIKHKQDPMSVTPDECTTGALSDLPAEKLTCGAPMHSVKSWTVVPLIGQIFGPLNIPGSWDEISNDRSVVCEPFIDEESKT